MTSPPHAPRTAAGVDAARVDDGLLAVGVAERDVADGAVSVSVEYIEHGYKELWITYKAVGAEGEPCLFGLLFSYFIV